MSNLLKRKVDFEDQNSNEVRLAKVHKAKETIEMEEARKKLKDIEEMQYQILYTIRKKELMPHSKTLLYVLLAVSQDIVVKYKMDVISTQKVEIERLAKLDKKLNKEIHQMEKELEVLYKRAVENELHVIKQSEEKMIRSENFKKTD